MPARRRSCSIDGMTRKSATAGDRTPSRDTIAVSMAVSDKPSTPLAERRTRPLERFWPYVERPEEPTADELAALDPDLHAALFGPRDLPFSITLVFPRVAADSYERAVALARESAEYREVGTGDAFRHRARFFSTDALKLRDLFQLVGDYHDTEVLIDDRPVPYARELWLPLIWFLLLR